LKKSIIIVAVVVIVAILQFTYFMKNQPSTTEQKEEIYFVVDQVEIAPDSTYSFYDAEGNKFTSYTFPAPTTITKGDIIAKEANSSEIIVYRFDQNGKKDIFLRVNR